MFQATVGKEYVTYVLKWIVGNYTSEVWSLQPKWKFAGSTLIHTFCGFEIHM